MTASFDFTAGALPAGATLTRAAGPWSRTRRVEYTDFDLSGGVLPTGASIARAAGPWSRRGESGALVKGSAADVARFDYDPPVGGAPAVCRGLILEPERSNVIANVGETFDQWLKDGSNIAVAANAGLAPDGTMTADRLDVPAVSASRSIIVQQQNSPAAPLTLSVWLRGVSGGETTYLMGLDYYNGEKMYALACSLTTSWQRFTLTIPTASSLVYFFLGVDLRFGGGVTAKPAHSMYAWGASWETGASASSYAFGTRPAEALRLPAAHATDASYDVALSYADGSTETRTGTIAAGVLSLPASSTPRVIAKARVIGLPSGVPETGTTANTPRFEYSATGVLRGLLVEPAAGGRPVETLALAWGAQGVANGPQTIRYTYEDGTLDVVQSIAGGSSNATTAANRPLRSAAHVPTLATPAGRTAATLYDIAPRRAPLA